MKIRLFIFLVVMLFSSVLFVAGDSCDSFCLEKEYSYGACRETTENEGFCEGNDEIVYGFDTCENLERCCCGYSAEESVSETSDEVVSTSSVPTAQDAFWPLVVIVVLLALAVIIKQTAFREEKNKEIKEK